MAIDQFVPEVWSALLRRYLDATLVYAGPTMTNRNYEGEIAQEGDTVHIQQIGDGGTIKTYVPNTDIDPPEAPDGTEQTLVVDQSKYYNIGLDDVNRIQAHVELLTPWAQRTARKFRVIIDAFVAGRMQAAAPAENTLGSDAVPIEVKADGTGDFTPYRFFVELRRRMHAQDAEDGLWAVIDEDLEAEVLNDDKYIPAGDAATRSGEIGRIAGFTIFRTTAVPTSPGSGGVPVPNAKIIFGSGNYATTVAHQLSELVAYNPERRFADAIKGLELYGAKVIEPETLGLAHVASL